MAFSIETINLSMSDPELDVPLTANVYRVDGIERQLSIGELVMCICLQRATELETQIIAQMETMAKTTNNLEEVTRLQEAIIQCQADGKDETFSAACTRDLGSKMTESLTWYVQDADGKYASNAITVKPVNTMAGAYEFLTRDTTSEKGGLGISSTDIPQATATVSEVAQAISSKMDTYNTQSQKETIELQSMTNKRDQSYDLITNMLKSMSTAMSGISANFAR